MDDENCALEDRSACAQFNDARLTLTVEKMEKGKMPPPVAWS